MEQRCIFASLLFQQYILIHSIKSLVYLFIYLGCKLPCRRLLQHSASVLSHHHPASSLSLPRCGQPDPPLRGMTPDCNTEEYTNLSSENVRFPLKQNDEAKEVCIRTFIRYFPSFRFILVFLSFMCRERQ